MKRFIHGVHTWFALAFMVLLLLPLAACGGKSGDSASSSAASYSGENSAERMSATASDGDISPYGEMESGAAQEAEGEAPDAEGISAETIRQENRKLITTVNVEAESEEYDQAISWLKRKLAEVGGYTEHSDVYAYSGDNRSCELRLRIPAEKLDGFLSGLEENCNILWRSEAEEDVTLDYVDTKSHRDALEVEQERLLELLEKAETLEEILKLEDRLTNVRYQLQNYETVLRTLDSKINYSTLVLSLREVKELTEPEPESFGSRAASGMRDNAKAIGQFFMDLALFILVHLPVIGLLAAVALIVLFCTRKRRREIREQRRHQKELLQAMRSESSKKQEDQKE